MKRNSKLILTAIITLVIGYGLGAYIGLPCVDSQMLSGDIGKVNKYNKQVSEDVKVFQERLQNDKEFCEQTVTSLAVISSRINEFKVLVDATSDIAKNIPELKESVEQLANTKELANNAAEEADSALHALGYLVAGNTDSGYNYEQMAQNATLSYMFIDKQVEAGKDFVENVDKYLQGKNIDDVKEIALMRDLWLEFCSTSAALNDDKADMAYWTTKKSVVRTEDASANEKITATMSPELKSVLRMKETFGIEIPIGKPMTSASFKNIEAALNNVVNLSLNCKQIPSFEFQATVLGHEAAKLDFSKNALGIKCNVLALSKNTLGIKNSALQHSNAILGLNSAVLARSKKYMGPRE